MFFVAEGLAEVFLDLSKPALATVGKGKFFGEGALLELYGLRLRVRSDSFQPDATRAGRHAGRPH